MQLGYLALGHPLHTNGAASLHSIVKHFWPMSLFGAKPFAPTFFLRKEKGVLFGSLPSSLV